MTPAITISERAVASLGALLSRQPDPGTQLRIYVINPGTSLAHCGIAYAPPDGSRDEDARLGFEGFDLLYKSADAPFLDGASLDYQRTPTGYKLSLKAPHIKRIEPPAADAPLSHRITYVLETEVNPSLSEHDGTVMLHEVREGKIAALKFGGGCHGCGHADHTLRHFVAKVLQERLPEIAEVIDDTDHGDSRHGAPAGRMSASA